MRLDVPVAVAMAVLLATLPSAAATSAASLETDLGRNETRIRSEAFPLQLGMSVHGIHLADRLDALGYDRVKRKPERPGEYFFGFDNFRVYRRAHRHQGSDHPARSFVLRLDRESGEIQGASDGNGQPISIDRLGSLWLEPELIAESLAGDRAVRKALPWSRYPEHVWQPLLAIEDSRFFNHGGIDGRSVARALLANIKKGGVAQGGSTITQQLIKNRDLSPKRSLGRKASEALRALALEADYSKEEILEAYLNHVYLGHVDGLAVHGYASAAQVYFSKSVSNLSLSEAACLAAMVQGPNRLSPERHAERLRARRNLVLDRMEELGWGSLAELRRARSSSVQAKRSAPRRPGARDFLRASRALLAQELDDRLESGRGVVVETTLDPFLQRQAEEQVEEHLSSLRRRFGRLKRGKLSAALIALDAKDGAVLAYVGGDPADENDEFDRVRQARRQPGSTVKPLLLLEAFEDCGSRQALYPSTRISDDPLRVPLPSGDWNPKNFDRKNHGVVDVRRSLVESLNLPFVRMTGWCGIQPTANRLRKLGLTVPASPPISLSLGSLEASPLEIARAFSVFPGQGKIFRPYSLRRVERPAGGRLYRERVKSDRVVDATTAWLVRDLMLDAVRRGTGRAADPKQSTEAFGKTGTSSNLRDAWFAGQAGGVLAVVWVGLDDGDLGLTGSAAAAPLWREFMSHAVGTRPATPIRKPARIVESWVDESTGLRLADRKRGSRREIYRRGAWPKRDRFWRPDPEDAVIYWNP